MLQRPERVKRTRASLPKVRTGCTTCKIRRIKCDEKKPACLKCIDTGRVCDGYAPERTFQARKVAAVSTSAIQLAPSSSISGTTLERRSFDFFRFQTGQELAKAIHLPSWHQLILQASHFSPAVRHATVAIGSLGERFLIHNVLTSGNPKADACHVYASEQYNKAIGHLRKDLSSQNDDIVLLTLVLCFLFTCYEFLQGNEIGAWLHQMNGQKILRAVIEGDASIMGHGPLISSSPMLAALKDDVIRVYALMDLHAKMWLALKSFKMPEVCLETSPEDIYCSPTVTTGFESLEDASVSLVTQLNQIFVFQRSIPPTGRWVATDPSFTRSVAEHDRLKAQLEKWPDALELVITQLREELTPEDLHLVGMMRMNHRFATISLATSLEAPDDDIVAQLEPDFVQIVALATSLLNCPRVQDSCRTCPPSITETPDHGPGSPMPLFSFKVGIIAPLFYAATRCRNRKVSQHAISLLETRPWREGAWDSAAMAKIAERKVQTLAAEGWYCTQQNLVLLNAQVLTLDPPPVSSSSDAPRVEFLYTYSAVAKQEDLVYLKRGQEKHPWLNWNTFLESRMGKL